VIARRGLLLIVDVAGQSYRVICTQRANLPSMKYPQWVVQ
jgi:hypothetical protein